MIHIKNLNQKKDNVLTIVFSSLPESPKQGNTDLNASCTAKWG